MFVCPQKFGESKYKCSLEENILNKDPKFFLLMTLQKTAPSEIIKSIKDHIIT